MSDSLNMEEQKGLGEPVGYERPTLTKVGNVRELLAGDGGTVTDLDTSAEEPQSSPQ